MRQQHCVNACIYSFFTMLRLVLIRHGESTWDLENRFTGWTDVDLSPEGMEQARNAGSLLKAEGFEFDIGYTSVLKRATRTLWHVLDELDRTWLPVVNSWRLNERHYGRLQGHNKAAMAQQHGSTQMQSWRRGFDTPPPALEPTDPRCERGDVRYAKLSPVQIPLTESPKDSLARVMPFWNEALAPAIRMGKRGLVAAHGSSLLALVQCLGDISDEDIVSMNIRKGIPLVYELDDGLKPIRHYYLGDAEGSEVVSARTKQ
jgi:2,3-bisphosphoglycerate-dependent phosphoglycerate mutase